MVSEGAVSTTELFTVCPAREAAPFRGTETWAAFAASPCASVAPQKPLTIPAAVKPALLIYRFGTRKHPYLTLPTPGSNQGGEG